MPITVEESGLTQEQYDALMYQTENADWKVIAHRYNLDFAFVDNGLTRSDKSFWDAISIPSFNCVALVMNNTIKFLNEDGTLSTLPDITFSGANLTAIYAPSLFWDGSLLHVFYATSTTAVNRHSYTLSSGGHTLQSTTAMVLGLGTNETVSHISAVAANRLHYVISHSTRRTHQFAVASTSAATKSRIYYQYPIQSFSAVEFDGKDVIVAATQTPGAIAIKVVGTEIQKSIEYSGGILGWTYGNGIWADHYNIDVIDKLNEPNVRKSVRLSVTHDRLALTAYVATGASPFTLGAYRLYTSKDGQHWSFGRILSIDTVGQNYGLKVATIGDSALLCDFGGVYHSDCTLELGYSPSSVQVDISADITKYTLSQSGAASANFLLDNEDGEYSNHPILNDDNTIVLEHLAGYFVDGVSRLVKVAMTEVDTFDEAIDSEVRTISVVSRDFLAWMSDKYNSENAQYWENQLIGGDTFIDTTETRYGGLRHTAVQSGTWETNDSKLELATKNKEGIAFSTFSPYIWNGAFESKFKLAQASNGEKAGLVFRALDKDNLWVAVYEQASDKIYLYEVRAGTKTQRAVQSGTMSWASAAVNNYRWLRVTFYYGLIKVFSSNDGVTWTERISHIATGQNPAGTIATILLDNGYVGYIGKGYHLEKTWDLPTYEIPDYSAPAPDINDGSANIIVISYWETPISDYSTPEATFGNNPPFGTYDFWSVLYDFAGDNPTSTANKKLTGQAAVDEWVITKGRYDGTSILVPTSPLGWHALTEIRKQLKTSGFGGVDEPEEIHKVRVGWSPSSAARTDVFILDIYIQVPTSGEVPGTYVTTYDPPDSGDDLVVKYEMKINLNGFFYNPAEQGGIRWVEIFGKGYFRP
jgi:hypothetical protein